MSTITRRSTHGPFEEIFDWLESPLALIRPAGHAMRVEDLVQDDRYVLRAELPGMDPAKDIDVTVSGGVLTIRADRLDETEGAPLGVPLWHVHPQPAAARERGRGTHPGELREGHPGG